MSSLLHLPDQVEAITVQVEALPLVTADGLIAIGAADEERLRALEDAAARLAAAARAKLDALASY